MLPGPSGPPVPFVLGSRAIARKAPARWRRHAALFRHRFHRRFERFRNGLFRRTVGRALDHRYLVLATGIGLLVLAVGIAASGRIGFTFFPSIEPDEVFASLKMIPGTARDETRERLFEIERAAHSAARSLGSPDIITHVSVVAGADQTRSDRNDMVGSVAV